MNKSTMIDDCLVDFLHMEVVDTFANQLCPPDSKEAGLNKLEQVGYTTGYRYVEKLTKDMPRFRNEELDIMKFICKEFWSSIFKKQIDNLRTNRSGVYVLHENRFRFITQISGSEQYVEMMPQYLAFTCGLIRGALADLGIESFVTAEVVSPPQCRFQVQIQRTFQI